MPDLAHDFQSLTPVDHKAVRREARLRSRQTGDAQVDFENQVWTIAHALRPLSITVGRDPTISIPGSEYRPDVVAMFDSFVLVAEATYTSSKSYVTEELSRVEIAAPRLTRYLAENSPPTKLVSILAVKDKAELHESIPLRASSARIKLLDARDLDYYTTLVKSAGVGIFHIFFSRVSPAILQVGEHSIPAIQIREGRRYKYIFSVNPHELLERAFISHRELTSPDEAHVGYQRMLNKKKLREVASYVSRNQSFPAPIIVSFPKNAGENFKPASKKGTKGLDDVTPGHLDLPKKPASVYVVDGQHRLYGYTLLPRSDAHQINVIAYKGLLPKHQGAMFVDINLKQTKVPARLLWELYPDILSPDDDEYFKAVISRSLEKLISSDITGLVTHISSGSKGSISFQALCAEVVRARLLTRGGAGIVATVAGSDWGAQEDRLHTILSAFFKLLNSHEPQWPEVNHRFFLQNSGIIPLIRELGKACRHITMDSPSALKSAKSTVTDALAPYFEPLYAYYGPAGSQQLDDLTRTRVGSSGFIETEDEMDDVIRIVIPTFPLREKRSNRDLERETEALVASIQEINRLAHDKSREWVFSEFDKDRVLRALSRPARDPAALETFVGTLYQELVEASAGKPPKNRALELLAATDMNQVPSLRKLSLLRHMSAHRASHLEPARRRQAVDFLRQLSSDPAASDFDRLQPDRCVAVQMALAQLIRTDFLDALITALRT